MILFFCSDDEFLLTFYLCLHTILPYFHLIIYLILKVEYRMNSVVCDCIDTHAFMLLRYIFSRYLLIGYILIPLSPLLFHSSLLLRLLQLLLPLLSIYFRPSFSPSTSAKIRRSPLRYAGLDTDPDVTYDRMPLLFSLFNLILPSMGKWMVGILSYVTSGSVSKPAYLKGDRRIFADV